MIKEKIKNLRTKKGASQQDVADYLNVKRPTYTRYESGTNEPDLETVVKLADYFEVSVDYLLDRDTPEESAPNNVDLSAKEEAMLQMFRAASPDFQDRFLALFETALKESSIIQ